MFDKKRQVDLTQEIHVEIPTNNPVSNNVNQPNSTSNQGNVDLNKSNLSFQEKEERKRKITFICIDIVLLCILIAFIVYLIYVIFNMVK